MAFGGHLLDDVEEAIELGAGRVEVVAELRGPTASLGPFGAFSGHASAQADRMNVAAG
jgi:hypothetical protein